MSQLWTESAVQHYIDNEIEESLTLEYKGPESLAKTSAKRGEITKDVSAMANSAGGLIFYGVSEFQDQAKEHLPERIDPVNRGDFSREWLEQVISNVQPRIADVLIHAVPIGANSNDVVYVVEIQQSTRPHQAYDKRYYRRYNFQSVPLDDYEINDIRGRQVTYESLVYFDVVVKKSNAIFFVIENPGSVQARNVTFSFSREPVWHDKQVPSAFINGITSLPPKRRYAFFYRQFINLHEDETVPTNFDVAVSYFHPLAGRRIEEDFHVDFADFSRTILLKTDMEEHTEKTRKELRDLTKQMKGVKEGVEKLLRAVGPTGLQLSDTTLRNLRHIVAGDDFLEKIDPDLFPLNIGMYQELLGVDHGLASKIAWHLYQPPAGRSLRDLEGMTSEIYETLHDFFMVDEEE